MAEKEKISDYGFFSFNLKFNIYKPIHTNKIKKQINIHPCSPSVPVLSYELAKLQSTLVLFGVVPK